MDPVGKNIASAFVKAQAAFAPAIKRSDNNHFGSKYADLATCVEAVIDSLNDNGIALMQVTDVCDNGVIVETRFIHSSGECISSGRIHIPAVKVNAHGFGSALTYARRYSLMCAAVIAPEDDDGNAAVDAQKGRPAAPPAKQYPIVKLSDAGIETIKALAAEVGFDIAQIEKFYGVPLAEIDGAEHGKIMRTLEKKKSTKTKGE